MFVWLDPTQQRYLDRMVVVARESVLPQATDCDRSACFPTESFAAIVGANLHAPAVPKEYGGLGLRHDRHILTLWMMTRELAKVDLAFTRCWEGHGNAQILLTGMGNPQQQQKWFAGIVQRGEKWAVWSGEPLGKLPDREDEIGTRVQKVNEGYLINGTKVFATTSVAADWAILLVSLAGAGGARHHCGNPEDVLMLACDLTNAGVSFDKSWWQPIGMRGSVSYRVQFKDVLIPQENLIGYPGQFLLEEWQTRFTPQYGAAFLGAAEGAYEYALDCIAQQKSDPYVQHRIARADINIKTAYLWLQHIANLWETGNESAAKQLGNYVRYSIEKLAMETVEHCLHLCGARALAQPSLLERTYRDLSFYTLHDRSDRVLATIGREILGEKSDRSFFKV
ncbi:MAG: acyl-CoA/acyl-ACP dehydrogenase [Cyanobacteria bacterium SBLK]|nr:acyl-CoA/acyl-ACP dehydrogenase [Cyanobacteria bacterium SBLK]